MAKIENAKHNDNFTLAGTMPPDKIKRFKLPPTLENPLVAPTITRNSTIIKKIAESIKSYRQTVHGVHEKRLPSAYRYSAHYFAIQHTRGDSDNPKDRRGLYADVVTTQPTPA
jgi:hypothetical protein